MGIVQWCTGNTVYFTYKLVQCGSRYSRADFVRSWQNRKSTTAHDGNEVQCVLQQHCCHQCCCEPRHVPSYTGTMDLGQCCYLSFFTSVYTSHPMGSISDVVHPSIAINSIVLPIEATRTVPTKNTEPWTTSNNATGTRVLRQSQVPTGFVSACNTCQWSCRGGTGSIGGARVCRFYTTG